MTREIPLDGAGLRHRILRVRLILQNNNNFFYCAYDNLGNFIFRTASYRYSNSSLAHGQNREATWFYRGIIVLWWFYLRACPLNSYSQIQSLYRKFQEESAPLTLYFANTAITTCRTLISIVTKLRFMTLLAIFGPCQLRWS